MKSVIKNFSLLKLFGRTGQGKKGFPFVMKNRITFLPDRPRKKDSID
ncbi:hypothetical protein LEP1GSC193_4410 [Leptospira alstonii serovar Pingchang str. 80-412]|uniref:Uncharacterized protein n=1 Tax=Leptospira alstonii serovar Pingchang str. 80-412 TaxID=1218564 RepID=T0FRD1_9LEPT|nr:hypothetical protein LEP1GSC193_4410 [Leptospira alstonii serovar Pingchang str. 80-412]